VHTIVALFHYILKVLIGRWAIIPDYTYAITSNPALMSKYSWIQLYHFPHLTFYIIRQLVRYSRTQLASIANTYITPAIQTILTSTTAKQESAQLSSSSKNFQKYTCSLQILHYPSKLSVATVTDLYLHQDARHSSRPLEAKIKNSKFTKEENIC